MGCSASVGGKYKQPQIAVQKVAASPLRSSASSSASPDTSRSATMQTTQEDSEVFASSVSVNSRKSVLSVSDNVRRKPVRKAQPHFMDGTTRGVLTDYYDWAGPVIHKGSGFTTLIRPCAQCGTNFKRVTKQIDTSNFKREHYDRLTREVISLRMFNGQHSFIIQLLESYAEGLFFWFVFESCEGGRLLDAIRDAPLNEMECAYFILRALLGIHYMHAKSVAHRSIKPEHIFLKNKGNIISNSIRIGCLEMAASFEMYPVFHDPNVGALFYNSPQVLSGTYTHACDIWSAGVVLYVSLCGFPPFECGKNAKALVWGKSGSVGPYDNQPFRYNFAEWRFSDLSKNFIEHLLTNFEPERPSAEEMLQDIWLQKYAPDRPPAWQPVGEAFRGVR